LRELVAAGLVEGISGFRDDSRPALDDAAALLAGDDANSDAWYALAASEAQESGS
jgi:hypothetical protein